MLRSPVPAFPAIGITHLEGKSTHVVEKVSRMSMGCIDRFTFAVTIALHQNGMDPIGFMNPIDLRGDEGTGFIPGDAYIFACSPVLCVSVSLGIPVDPLEGIGNAVSGVDPFFIGQRERAGE